MKKTIELKFHRGIPFKDVAERFIDLTTNQYFSNFVEHLEKFYDRNDNALFRKNVPKIFNFNIPDETMDKIFEYFDMGSAYKEHKRNHLKNIVKELKANNTDLSAEKEFVFQCFNLYTRKSYKNFYEVVRKVGGRKAAFIQQHISTFENITATVDQHEKTLVCNGDNLTICYMLNLINLKKAEEIALIKDVLDTGHSGEFNFFDYSEAANFSRAYAKQPEKLGMLVAACGDEILTKLSMEDFAKALEIAGDSTLKHIKDNCQLFVEKLRIYSNVRDTNNNYLEELTDFIRKHPYVLSYQVIVTQPKFYFFTEVVSVKNIAQILFEHKNCDELLRVVLDLKPELKTHSTLTNPALGLDFEYKLSQRGISATYSPLSRNYSAATREGLVERAGGNMKRQDHLKVLEEGRAKAEIEMKQFTKEPPKVEGLVKPKASRATTPIKLNSGAAVTAPPPVVSYPPVNYPEYTQATLPQLSRSPNMYPAPANPPIYSDIDGLLDFLPSVPLQFPSVPVDPPVLSQPNSLVERPNSDQGKSNKVLIAEPFQ